MESSAEFLSAVRRRARTGGGPQTGSAVRAVLRTLGERLPEALVMRVADCLPADIGDHLRHAPTGHENGSYSARRGFIVGVGARAGLDEPNAAFVALAVFERLNAVVDPDIMTGVRHTLPPDLRGLASAGAPRTVPPQVALPVPTVAPGIAPRVAIRNSGASHHRPTERPLVITG